MEKITISACKQIWLSTGYFLYREMVSKRLKFSDI